VSEIVAVQLADGRTAELHRLVLRDGCPCAECRHPVSGQRLFESYAVVPDARIESFSFADGALEVEWADGHRSTFAEEWLEAEADAAADGRPARADVLWGSELDPALVTATFREVEQSDDALRRWLGLVAAYGFGVLKSAPTVDGTVASVAELFSFVRTTNYGRIFDVAVRVDATNLADTSMALSLHTDNAYRVPTPTLQLLQCMVSDVEGGATVLADGFRAVGALAPAQLQILAETPIRFAYRDASADLSADVPIVEVGADGSPRALHVNNRSKGLPAGLATRVAEWYEAYFELLRLLEQPEAQVVFRLDPGDVVLFDNLRVLHARTGFSGEGARRLQGCYADRDGLLSTLAVLERGLQ
jgi:gamma-butyrobetaine dioxygenase